MRSLLAIAAMAIFSVATFGLANNAYATYVYDNEEFGYTISEECTEYSVNDLHITYYCHQKLELEWHVDDGFTDFDTIVSGDRTQWQCIWSGRTLYNGDTVHVGVKFDEEGSNELKKKDIYWTKDGEFVCYATGPGFKVEPPGGPGAITYTLFNSTSDTFTIRDLQFRFSAQETPLDSMLYGQVPGFDPPIADSIVLLPSDSVSYVLPHPKTLSSYYVMAQGRVEQDGDSVGNFVQQHEHPRSTPTLTQWGLIILVVLIVSSGVFIMRRRKKAAVQA